MIKYFCLLAIGLLGFCTSRAQIKKGEKLLGAYLQFSNEVDKSTQPPGSNDKQHIITVNPSFGVAIRDNLEVGGRLSYGFAKNEDADDQHPQEYTMKWNSYGLAAYIRRYKVLGHGFAAYLETGVSGNYSLSKSSYETTPGLYTDAKGWSVAASLLGGMTYRVTHRWMLEAGFLNLVSVGVGGSTDKGLAASMGQTPGKSTYFSVGSDASNMLKNFTFGCRYILD